MPVQLFPPSNTQPRTASRRRWGLRLGLVCALLLMIVAAIAGSPLLLLNTDFGRVLLRAAANCTDNGHLALSGSRLSLYPETSLELQGLKLSRPFDTEAPTLALDRFHLENLSYSSRQPGRPLSCERAVLTGIDAE